MNSVYESLRALLRAKELEIKKLEKEIEALRIVLPIVAEANPGSVEAEPATSTKFTADAGGKSKPFATGSNGDIESVLAQAISGPAGSDRNIPAPDLTPKSRSNWP
jgi:hypothetical protein